MSTRLTAILAIALQILVVFPAAAQNGPWYGAYAAAPGPGDVEVLVELDQLPGGATGMASVGLFPLTGRCPTGAMSQSFCNALNAAYDSAQRQGVPANEVVLTEGVVFEGDVAAIVFAIRGDPDRRIIEIVRGGNGYKLSIHHPQRGFEAELAVQRQAHSCEFSMCSADRLNDLRANPASYAGPLGALAFLRAYPMLALNQGAPPAPARAPAPANGQDPSYLWEVLAMGDGRPLGTLYLRGANATLSGDGTLNSVGFGPATEVRIAPERTRGNGFGLHVTYFASGSGEQREALLLLGASRNGLLEGTLIEDTYVETVRLIRDDGAGPMHVGGVPPEEFWPDPEHDLPGIGVYGPSYVLRNVPPGQRLSVREAPSRDAVIAGTLARNAVDILVLGCTPDIDSLVFEQADIAGKRSLLDAAWCEVSHGTGAAVLEGWVVGGYLEPVLNEGAL